MPRLLAFLTILLSLNWPCLAESLTVLTGNIEPYAIENGSRHGFAVEIVQEMGRRAGVDIDIRFLPWQRALTEANRGSNVAIVPVVRTVERESRYTWVAPIMPGEPFYLMAIRPDIDISGFDAVRGRTIGAMSNAPAESILRQAGLHNLDLAPENSINAKKLLLGRFDVWFARAEEAKRALMQLGADPARLRHGPPITAPSSYLAASPDFPAVIAQKLARAFDEIKADGSLERIVGSYDYGWLLTDQSDYFR